MAPDTPKKLDENAKRILEIQGAKPDQYDLEMLESHPNSPTQSFSQPLPKSGVFTSEDPLSLPSGPRPELLYGKGDKYPESYSDSSYLSAKQKRPFHGNERGEQPRLPELPEKPLLTRLLHPFTVREFQNTFFTMLAIGTLPTAAFAYAGPKGFQLFASGIAGAGGDVAFYFLVLITSAVVLCSFWVSLMTTYLLDLFVATVDGDDRLENRPGFSYVEGLFQTGHLVFVGLLALIPGYLVWLCLNLFYQDMHGAAITLQSIFDPISVPLRNENGDVISKRVSFVMITTCLASLWIFFPIFFLFSNETREANTPSFGVVRSLSLLSKVWGEFYYLTLPIVAFFACFVYSYFINGIFLETLFDNAVLYVSFLFFGTFGLVLYFRLLGRLAWVIVNAFRRVRES